MTVCTDWQRLESIENEDINDSENYLNNRLNQNFIEIININD